MKLTDLREELADQADQMDSRHPGLLPGARRHARRTRAIRTTTIAAGVGVVAIGSFLVAPNLLPSRDDAPAFDVPVAAAPSSTPRRAPIHGVIRDRQPRELAAGVVFTITGKTWNLVIANPCAGCTKPETLRSVLPPQHDALLGMHSGWRPNDRLQAMDLVRGNATRVVYTVRLPGQAVATYEADLYRLAGTTGWMLAYLEFPANGLQVTMQNERQISVRFRAYDAAGKLLTQPYPR